METIQSKSAQGRVADAPSGHWVYRFLPRPLWPYAQLARWDRPIGWWLLLWPCWWSVAMAVGSYGPKGGMVYLWAIFHLGLYWIGAIAMRGAGCTYNDWVDRDIDDRIARTRSRPLPSGRVSSKQALMFLALQALVGLAVLLQFNRVAILLGLGSLIVVAVYPFMKRVTNWPQLWLGLAFSWGALMGWTGLYGELAAPALWLYGGTVFWVVGYDTIYAHQDKDDDALVGVRSTARLFGDHTKTALIALYGGALLMMFIAFAKAELPMPALAGLLAAGAHMARQIRVLDIDDPDQCLALFKSNTIVGWLIFAGLIGGIAWGHARDFF